MDPNGRELTILEWGFAPKTLFSGLAGKYMWVGLFNFFAVLGYLVTMAALITMKGGDTAKRLKTTGGGGAAVDFGTRRRNRSRSGGTPVP